MATKQAYKPALLSWLMAVIGLLAFTSCSPTAVITTEVIQLDSLITPKPILDSLIVLNPVDSTLVGIIRDESGDSIGYVKANPSTRTAEVFAQPPPIEFHYYYHDSDTMYVNENSSTEQIFSLLNWWEESIVFIVIGFLFMWKTKRKVPLI